jgi:hypothetical protein
MLPFQKPRGWQQSRVILYSIRGFDHRTGTGTLVFGRGRNTYKNKGADAKQLAPNPGYPTANAIAASCRQQRHLMNWPAAQEDDRETTRCLARTLKAATGSGHVRRPPYSPLRPLHSGKLWRGVFRRGIGSSEPIRASATDGTTASSSRSASYHAAHGSTRTILTPGCSPSERRRTDREWRAPPGRGRWGNDAARPARRQKQRLD